MRKKSKKKKINFIGVEIKMMDRRIGNDEISIQRVAPPAPHGPPPHPAPGGGGWCFYV
jgi:hypothetical protein